MFNSGTVSKVLQKAQVRLINHTTCDVLMEGQLTSRMTCAGILVGGVDACQVINPTPLFFSVSVFFFFCPLPLGRFYKIVNK